jgi:hypothetical protein
VLREGTDGRLELLLDAPIPPTSEATDEEADGLIDPTALVEERLAPIVALDETRLPIEEELDAVPAAELRSPPLKELPVPVLVDDRLERVAELEAIKLLDAVLLLDNARLLEPEDVGIDVYGVYPVDVTVSMNTVLPLGSLWVMTVTIGVSGMMVLTAALLVGAASERLVEGKLREEAEIPAGELPEDTGTEVPAAALLEMETCEAPGAEVETSSTTEDEATEVDVWAGASLTECVAADVVEMPPTATAEVGAECRSPVAEVEAGASGLIEAASRGKLHA